MLSLLDEEIIYYPAEIIYLDEEIFNYPAEIYRFRTLHLKIVPK